MHFGIKWGMMRLLNETSMITERIRMQIKVKNVAKILDAEVVLDGVTVLAGYNNMGKSTILKAAYTTLSTFRNMDDKIRVVRRQSIESYFSNLESRVENKERVYIPSFLRFMMVNDINRYIDVFMGSGEEDYLLFRKLFLNKIDGYENSWLNNLDSDMLHSDEFLVPIYKKVKEICTRSKESDLKYIGEMYIRNVFKGQMNSLHHAGQASVCVDSSREHYHILVEENKITKMEYSANMMADIFYLPAYNLLDVIDSFDIEQTTYSPEYDIKSALSKQEKEPTLEEYQEIEDNATLIKRILEEVIDGRLERQPSGNIFFKDGSVNDSISIANVASGMKSFLIIKALVENGKLRKNGILLIDEPETNLHPEWQLKFAEILVLMYKYMGVRSIVSSHSPYFIRALEVKMADHGIKEMGHYYVMEEAEKNLFKVRDVTQETDKIYELLYKPLEYLS